MQVVVILQQMLPKILSIVRENVKNCSNTLIQPVATTAHEEHLGFYSWSIKTALNSAGLITESWHSPDSEGQKLCDCGHLEPILPDRAS